jgi:hypothetical protein
MDTNSFSVLAAVRKVFSHGPLEARRNQCPFAKSQQSPHHSRNSLKTIIPFGLSAFILCLLRFPIVFNSHLLPQRLQYLGCKGILSRSKRF